MPIEIEFSLMSDDGQALQPLLDAFEADTGIRVLLRFMDWDEAWNQLVRAAIYNDGPDISEIGTTWTGDLIGMNALRPFTSGEIASMGRSQIFVPASWANAVPTGERSWAIPWAAGSRLIFYRPRLFEAAGVDPSTAFNSLSALDAAADCLHAHGSRVPLAIPTGGTHATLHNIASWIWAAGGDFVRSDGKIMALLEPEALEGMCQYFALGRFLGPEIPLLGAEATEDYFSQHTDTAMVISGTWLITTLGARAVDLARDVRVAHLPGPSFVGGSNLVIWKYSRQAEAAVQFARFLTQTEVQVQLSAGFGLLPVRIDALDAAPYATQPLWKMAAQALRSGRTFPSIRLWGVIEDRLSAGMDAVWKAVLANPSADPRDALVRCLTPLCQRLDLMLQDK